MLSICKHPITREKAKTEKTQATEPMTALSIRVADILILRLSFFFAEEKNLTVHPTASNTDISVTITDIKAIIR